MTGTRHDTLRLALVLVGLVLAGMPIAVQAGSSRPKVINLRPTGPRPAVLKIRAGTPVVWVSHLASTKLMVTTVAFLEGPRLAKATTAVESYNGFDVEGEHFVGRMEGNGGMVALRFVIPGEYTYTVDHLGHVIGRIVVRQ